MTGDEIRAAFLAFFKEKGHDVVPSSSLIPHGDPTLLLTSAGMVQFKPYYLGEEKPANPRMASVQKCFRTTDIESVGDSSHLTFFEMLGNFSIGDYFKEDTIKWGWEFVTQKLKMPPQRLWVTIYLDDDEAFEIWKRIGVPENRILRYGRKDNFWGPAGDSGPCGPSSEIHYDFGTEVGCGRKECAPDCGCGRFSELWNLVFVQFNQDKEGNRTPLPCPSIDTGMGLERVAAILQGKNNVYETDLFTPLLNHMADVSGKTYGSDGEDDRALRVAAEHARAIAFLIADGVLPANDGRGYVLRRLLRRAALFGRRLGLKEPFLADAAAVAIKQMGAIYPELIKRRDFVLELIGLEEARFENTLATGLELLDGILDKAASQVRGKISGQDAFRLYDTYGFPVELTREIASGRGLSVDMEGFDKEMAAQREKARAAHRFELAGKSGLTQKLKLAATSFTGYESLSCKAVVGGMVADGQAVKIINEGQEAALALDVTPFYAEMGGQLADTGHIITPEGSFTVEDTIRLPSGVVLHQGRVVSGSISAGAEVTAEVDGERRQDIARNHTATHLLHYALRQVLGEHVQQRGSEVGPERLRFDFSHLKAMTKEEIRSVEKMVNENIRRNMTVSDKELAYKQAISEGVTALFGEKYGDTVRVLSIGQPALSAELCGGTHVAATGEIGLFRIISESSIGAGLRRIEAATGRGAEAYIVREMEELKAEAAAFTVKLEESAREARTLEKKLALKEADSLKNKVVEIKPGVPVNIAITDPYEMDLMREIANVLRENKAGIVVLGTTYQGKPSFVVEVSPEMVEKGYHAGEIIKRAAAITGGSGGGKATLAQGGGRDKNKLDKALEAAKDFIRQSGD